MFDLGLYPAAVPASDGQVWGEVFEVDDLDAVLAALDEIEGYDASTPDTSLYVRRQVTVHLDEALGRRMGLLLQRAARASAAHRIGRLPRAPEGHVGACRADLRIAEFGSLIVVLAFAAPAAAQAPTLDARVVNLVAGVSAERLAADVQTLAGFGTRHTYSDTASPTRGIGAAREWIRAEFAKASPRLQVGFDTYQVVAQGPRLPRDVELRNVVAVLPGASPRRLYVSAHYDTRGPPHRRHAAVTPASTGRVPTTTRLAPTTTAVARRW